MTERDALKAAFSPWKIWLANVLGGAGLLAATYGWFWIPDTKIWHLAVSAVVALGIVFGFVYLTAATVAARAGSKPQLTRCAAWIAALSVWVGLIVRAGVLAPRQGRWLASLATMTLRKPVSPASVTPAVDFLWTVVLSLGIIALVPWLIRLAGGAAVSLRSRRYWLVAIVGVFVGFWLPWRLFHWAPGFEGFSVQVASVVIRAAVAWVVMVTAWLWLLALAAKSPASVVTSSD
ncbi:MAG: hypothetical protein LLG20_24415 [Acidobacteriales bacterium]|nr:hypothetical protein [Terriglobales bacterium]